MRKHSTWARLGVASVLCVLPAACGNAIEEGAPTAGAAAATAATAAKVTDAPRQSPAPVRQSDGPYAVLPLQGCTNGDYFADVVVGNNHFTLLMDSGSTTMAVAANTCADCGIADVYDTQSGKNLHRSAASSYGDGTGWQGKLYQDDVAMGLVGQEVTARVPVSFAAITQQNDFFATTACSRTGNVAFDGILGLGPDALLTGASTSFLTALAQSQDLGQDAFAVQICGVGGSLSLGGWDANQLTAAPRYAPLTQQGPAAPYYGLMLTDLGLGAQSIAPKARALGGSVAGGLVIDTGTSYLVFTPAMYQAFVAAITQNSAFLQYFSGTLFGQGACEQSAHGATRAQLDAALPKLAFTFANAGQEPVRLEVTATHSYLVPVTDGGGQVAYCPAVSEGGDGEPAIFGNAAMREHLVIFDRANQQVGFAPAVGCDDTVMPFAGN